MDKHKKRWLLLSEDFTENERNAVITFASILCQIVTDAHPAKFYSGKGNLVYAKYDCDLENEIKDLLGLDNEKK